MYKIPNRVKMHVANVPGYGPITLGNPVDGFQSFIDGACLVGDTMPYIAEDISDSWELGVGTLNDNGIFVRTSISRSSSGFALINLTSEAIISSGPLEHDFSNILRSDQTATLNCGFSFITDDLGTPAANSTIAFDPTNGNNKTIVNNSTGIVISAPTIDCDMKILVINGTNAGTLTFAGFTAPANGGADVYNTIAGNKFILVIVRIAGVSTYAWKALQ